MSMIEDYYNALGEQAARDNILANMRHSKKKKLYKRLRELREQHQHVVEEISELEFILKIRRTQLMDNDTDTADWKVKVTLLARIPMTQGVTLDHVLVQYNYGRKWLDQPELVRFLWKKEEHPEWLQNLKLGETVKCHTEVKFPEKQTPTPYYGESDDHDLPTDGRVSPNVDPV